MFKQKTAYEMRIRDWSSDVCSSDLRFDPPAGTMTFLPASMSRYCAWAPSYSSRAVEAKRQAHPSRLVRAPEGRGAPPDVVAAPMGMNTSAQIGRESCRERTSQ